MHMCPFPKYTQAGVKPDFKKETPLSRNPNPFLSFPFPATPSSAILIVASDLVNPDSKCSVVTFPFPPFLKQNKIPVQPPWASCCVL